MSRLPNRRKVSYLLAIILIAGLLINGCKKEDDTSGDNSNNGEGTRLKEWTYLGYDEYNSIIAAYENNRMTELIYRDIASNDIKKKITAEYTGNKARVIHYYKHGENFEIWSFHDRFFDGANLIETRSYDESEPGYPFTGRTVYTYSNNLLSEQISYGSEDISDPRHKTKYYHEEGKVVKHEYYSFENNQYVIKDKSSYEYENGQLSRVVGYHLWLEEWIISGKSEYSYEGNKVIIQDFDYQDEEWLLEYRVEAVLDNAGNTIELTEIDKYDNMVKLVLTYESGTGNFDGIILEPVYEFYPCLLPF